VNASRFSGLAFLTALLVAAQTPTAATCAPVIRLHGDKEPAVEVTGLPAEELRALARLEQTPEQWQALFAVYVERGDRARQPAMLGSHRVLKDALRFEPRFPLTPGVAYRAVFHPDRLPGHAGSTEPAVETVLRVPKPAPAAPTVVTHIYPSRDELPENTLKFYLHFSAPMSRGEAYDRIHLLDAAGKPVEAAFLELGQELWDPAGKRFTLFFDPGRIKRGLKPREDLGPALEAGKRYTLVIDRAWKDAEGNPLKETHRKAFRVLPPDEKPPDPKTWKLEAPSAGSRKPLVVTSPKALDHALFGRLVWVTDADGRKVPGRAEVTNRETRWTFTPDAAWAAGRYHLVADTRLEDLAGNSIGRPFEVDEFRTVERQTKAETVKVPFEVRAAPNP
jgi:hypothetical protein